MEVYVTFTLMKEHGHLSLFSYYLRALIFFVNEFQILLILPKLVKIFCYFKKLQKYIILQSKKEGKDQESIQSSTTPDPGYQWKSDKIHN